MSDDMKSAPDQAPLLSGYDEQVWRKLNEHWEKRNNRRGLPNWAGKAIEKTSAAGNRAAEKIIEITPEPVRRAGDALSNRAMRPVVEAAAALLELSNDWAIELNNPKGVEKIARKRGLDIADFTALRNHELKDCDRLLTANTLRWRTVGAVEGGAMGALALVPVAGIPLALTADVLVIQVLSASIASHIAYSYGFDAKNPDEQEFIQRLVKRTFMAQAAKAKPLSAAVQAANAAKNRVRWSPQLRADHRLLEGIEKLLQQLGPKGAHIPVTQVAKVAPFIGIVIGAGMNSFTLGAVAADAKRYCQTRFICEKYGLPLPAALTFESDEESLDEENTSDDSTADESAG